MPKLMMNNECYGSDDANDIVYDNSKSGLDSTRTQNAINELAVSINNLEMSFQDGCSIIANAITEMGVATANNASPNVMADNIKNIRTGITLTDYTIHLYCTESNKYQDDVDGVQRNSHSSFNLNVINYKTLYIGSYTTSASSSHGNGKSTVTFTCSVDNIQESLSPNGTQIDVSLASSVKLTAKVQGKYLGFSYNTSGSVTVSEIVIS